jgi:hypothetical protein
MSKALPLDTLLFRVHLIRVHGSQSNPTLRLILVESKSAQPVYEGFGSWMQCMRWIGELSGTGIRGDELAPVRRLLDKQRLVTMKDEVRASMNALEALGLNRVDS